jgi:hypothetical protein
MLSPLLRDGKLLLYMKRISFLSVLIGFTFVCYGQSQFGIFAGAQTTTAKYTIANIKQPTSYKYGFQTGAGWKIPFDNQLFFSPAAFYSLKGYKVKFNRYVNPPDKKAIDNNTGIHTFEFAFLLQYDLSKQPGHFFIKAGPSFDFQLFGKEKFNLKNDGGLVNRSMPYSLYDEYGRYSSNLLLQFGYETGSGFTIFGQYSHGLISLNNTENGPQIHHRVYGISIGKYFNKKKIVPDTRSKE